MYMNNGLGMRIILTQINLISPNLQGYTVELWSLELACLEHQGSLELVCRSRQTPYTFNVKIHPWLEQ